jgi:hypothetical protein
MGIPSSDPQYMIRPLQIVGSRRDNLCNSPECDLVCNPYVRGVSQQDNTTIGFDSPYRKILSLFDIFGKLSFQPIPNPYTLN